VLSRKPQAGALFNALRQCDISGLFHDDQASEQATKDVINFEQQDDSDFIGGLQATPNT